MESPRIEDSRAAGDGSLAEAAINQDEGFESIVEVDIDDWYVASVEE